MKIITQEQANALEAQIVTRRTKNNVTLEILASLVKLHDVKENKLKFVTIPLNELTKETQVRIREVIVLQDVMTLNFVDLPVYQQGKVKSQAVIEQVRKTIKKIVVLSTTDYKTKKSIEKNNSVKEVYLQFAE